MRILLDEYAPQPLRKSLLGHNVRTVQEMGWAGLENGELLLRFTTAAFDVFLTVDRNLQYQQNLRTAGLAIIVTAAPTNELTDLDPLMPTVVAALATIRPGELVEVGPDPTGP